MLLSVHAPFCRSRCHYCAFASQVPRKGEMEAWAAGVAAEARHWGAALGRPRIHSIHLGGGTPSLVPARLLEQVVGALQDNFCWADGLEFCVEATPDTAGYATLRRLRGLGATRLALGVQSLDDRLLKALGRIHTASQAFHACHAARDAGFPTLSLDMLWGLPGQRLRHWLEDLQAVAGLKPDHLCAYALAVEPGTALARTCRHTDMRFATEQEQARMYLAGARLLESAGLLQYEVSSFGRMGHYSQHHLGLWEGRDHLGLGPSSTSTVQGRRWTNPSELRLWRHVLRTGTLGVDAHALAPAQRARELVRLRLRTSRGLRLRGFRRLTGRDLLADHAALVATLRRHGLARVERGYLRLTRAGMLVSEVILDHVLPPAAATTPIRRRAADRSHADSA